MPLVHQLQFLSRAILWLSVTLWACCAHADAIDPDEPSSCYGPCAAPRTPLDSVSYEAIRNDCTVPTDLKGVFSDQLKSLHPAALLIAEACLIEQQIRSISIELFEEHARDYGWRKNLTGWEEPTHDQRLSNIEQARAHALAMIFYAYISTSVPSTPFSRLLDGRFVGELAQSYRSGGSSIDLEYAIAIVAAYWQPVLRVEAPERSVCRQAMVAVEAGMPLSTRLLRILAGTDAIFRGTPRLAAIEKSRYVGLYARAVLPKIASVGIETSFACGVPGTEILAQLANNGDGYSDLMLLGMTRFHLAEADGCGATELQGSKFCSWLVMRRAVGEIQPGPSGLLSRIQDSTMGGCRSLSCVLGYEDLTAIQNAQ
jgi:hypothetical protein